MPRGSRGLASGAGLHPSSRNFFARRCRSAMKAIALNRTNATMAHKARKVLACMADVLFFFQSAVMQRELERIKRRN